MPQNPKNDKNPLAAETITVSVPESAQTVIDVLQDQYGVLESGEVRAQLSTLEPEVWNAQEFEKLFDIKEVRPPYADVVRKQDGTYGTVMFIDQPRFYFTFNAGSVSNDDTRPA